MDRPIQDTLISLFVGGTVSGALYLLDGHLSLAIVTGLCWACGLKLTLHIGHLYPAYATGETWADNRWTMLSVGLMTLAALIGVSPALPLSDELRLGFGLLIIGTGLVAYAAGTLAVLERVDGNATDRSASSNAQYPMDSD